MNFILVFVSENDKSERLCAFKVNFKFVKSELFPEFIIYVQVNTLVCIFSLISTGSTKQCFRGWRSSELVLLFVVV